MVSKKWTVETLNATVDREIAALPREMRVKFERTARLIADFGLAGVQPRILRKLRGPLWEIRISGRDGISRVLYVTVRAKRVVVVRAFVKQTNRTPKTEIDLALMRAREVLR